MLYKIHPIAKRHLIKIWQYTEERWGEVQADKYIDGLYNVFSDLNSKTYLWRLVPHTRFKNVYVCPYEKHFIFFRLISENTIGIIGILHQASNLPSQFKDLLNKQNKESPF